MPSGNLFTEEGRTRFRNFGLRLWSYLLAFLALGVIVGALVFAHWTHGGMGPLERLYFRQYMKATVTSWALPNQPGKYVLLVSEREGTSIWVTDELVHPVLDDQGKVLRDKNGWLFKPYSGTEIDRPQWRRAQVRNSEMERWFRRSIYGGTGLPALFVPALVACLVVALIGASAAVMVDQRLNRKYEEGKKLRGSRLVSPAQYERELEGADGLGLLVRSMELESGLRRAARKLSRRSQPEWKLRMKRGEEAQGMLILGDIGSGKSQIIHRFLRQIGRRDDEAAIVYDPACEFVKAHYYPGRGDVILNPLDVRSPFWSFVFEQRYRTDTAIFAESFFPGRKPERMGQSELFFLNASREIFARMLEFEPHPDQLISWLSDETVIDKMVAGTELAHYIVPKAASQRGGVLGSLARGGKTLRILPRAEECEFDFSLSEWAAARKGWIFLTSTKETEEQLRPLYAAWLDLLMRRLMSVDEAWGRQHPVKLIVDEVHTLEYLPTLYKALTEGRKFGLHLFQGTQNKHQYDEHYGQAAPTMLSCPRYTIILRCKEPDSADWLSKLIGDEEIERPRTGVTASVSDQGRDSINYSSHTERRAVVSREEIANLTDLAGYWKYGEIVTPFRFDFTPCRKVADGFTPRRALAPVRPAIKQEKTSC
jgi:hypothetical protein